MYRNNYLMHYGVKGMKWGIRRYQNPDGSLTRSGRRKLAKALESIGRNYIIRSDGTIMQTKVFGGEVVYDYDETRLRSHNM